MKNFDRDFNIVKCIVLAGFILIPSFMVGSAAYEGLGYGKHNRLVGAQEFTKSMGIRSNSISCPKWGGNVCTVVKDDSSILNLECQSLSPGCVVVDTRNIEFHNR